MLPKSHFTSQKIRTFGSWGSFVSRNKNRGLLVLVALVAFGLGQEYLSHYSDYFRMSLITPTGVPYAGMEFPIKKVPNWVNLTDGQRYMNYSEIPQNKLINLPAYDIATFKAGMNWQKATEAQRNAYITYPVPHLGNYTLDGSEYSGSHPGIDIKVPQGTPVYASSAGKVYKTDYQPSGYGHHIVIQSDNVPDPDNPNKSITIFTTYAHLSQIKASTGQRVNKGDLIGLSGQSGMATAPHLHWQIDRRSAPFYGYWPFSWADVQKAGYSSYFEAVKGGLNQGEARKFTIHPAKMIATVGELRDTNLVASAGVVDSDEIPEITQESPTITIEAPIAEVVAPAETPKTTKTPTIQDSPESIERPVKSVKNKVVISFETDGSFIPQVPETIILKIENANLLSTNVIQMSSTLKELAQITPSRITKDLIKDGQVPLTVTTNSNQNFRIIATGPSGEEKSPMIKSQVFADVPVDHPYSESIAFLKDKGTIKGYADGSFGLFKNLTRAEAVKIILDANNIAAHHIPTRLLSDVPEKTWFAGWISAAISENIAKGYPDGTFRPGDTMTRAEFLKVAILTAGFPEASDLVASAGFKDVPDGAWFTGYMAFTQEHALLPPTNTHFIEPGKPITRGEAAYVLHQLWKVKH
ncbi:MAG TPA: peptidoglycan DD-metalloendopeptidase family protein [Candidatus Gracilibacteria bacterium]